MNLTQVSRTLCERVSGLSFRPPVAYVYNPLEYARVPHEAYLKRYGKGPKRALLLGMNPGPFGMAQTGVPFGDVSMVRDFLGVTGEVGKPAREHPKRAITGFECTALRGERHTAVGLCAERTSRLRPRFFEHFFVVNYCPLVFMEEGGKQSDARTSCPRQSRSRCSRRAMGRFGPS